MVAGIFCIGLIRDRDPAAPDDQHDHDHDHDHGAHQPLLPGHDDCYVSPKQLRALLVGWVRRLGELIGRRPAATWVKPDFYRTAAERAPAPQPDPRAPAGDVDFMKIVRHATGSWRWRTTSCSPCWWASPWACVLYLVIPSDLMANEYARWLSYPIMVPVGVPLYICASASTPIAAALVARGVSPGAAFVAGEIDRSRVLFTVEDATFRLADFATLSGIVSGGAFLLAALSAIVLLILFF